MPARVFKSKGGAEGGPERKEHEMGYKVAVLMGGQSFEREFSLLSGKNVCEALERAGH